MKQEEKEEILGLSEKYKPLNAWAYFGWSILLSIPLVGFILAIVFSISDKNINRRSFVRSYWCILIVEVVIVVILVVLVLTGVISQDLLDKLKGQVAY